MLRSGTSGSNTRLVYAVAWPCVREGQAYIGGCLDVFDLGDGWLGSRSVVRVWTYCLLLNSIGNRDRAVTCRVPCRIDEPQVEVEVKIFRFRKINLKKR